MAQSSAWPPRTAGTTKWGPLSLGGVGQRLFHVEPGTHHVVAKDVLLLDDLRSGWDGLRVQLGEHRVLVQDVVQLSFEEGDLLLAEPETCEVGDVLDVATGKGGHGPRIASRRRSGLRSGLRSGCAADGRPGWRVWFGRERRPGWQARSGRDGRPGGRAVGVGSWGWRLRAEVRPPGPARRPCPVQAPMLQGAPRRRPRRGPRHRVPGPWPAGLGVLAGHEVVGLAAHRTGRLAARGPDGRLGGLAIEALQRARHHERLAGQRSSPVPGRAHLRRDTDHADRCQLAEEPGTRRRRRRSGPGWLPPRRRCRALGESARAPRPPARAAMRRVHSASVSPGSGGQVSATQAARSMAVCSPTWRMPSAARMRESGGAGPTRWRPRDSPRTSARSGRDPRGPPP